MASCEKAVMELMEESSLPAVHTIQMDRERSITSKKFQASMRSRHGVQFQFFTKGSKVRDAGIFPAVFIVTFFNPPFQAFRAERQIKHLKNQLSIVCGLNATVVWTDFLRAIVASYNAQPAFDTSFIRAGITDSNFNAFLSEKLGLKDASLRHNTASLDISRMPDAWKSKLFRFLIGEKVLATVDSDWTVKKDAFYKKTVDGTYGSTVYTIARAALRNTRRKDLLVPGE